jgi:MFS family permease
MAEEVSAPVRVRGLFANRQLLLLWGGQIISQSGDALFELALIWMALELTGSSTRAGLIASATFIPSLLFGLFGGAVADRVDRRTLMLWSDGVRVLAAAAIPALALSGHLTVWSLGGLAFVLSVFTALFNPARDALLPSLVHPSQLTAANSLMQTCWQLSLLLGPLVGAALIPFLGVTHLFTVDALSFAASFALIAAMRTPRAGPATTDPAQASSTRGALAQALADVGEGLRFAARDRRIAALLAITALDNLLLMGPAIVGTPIFVKEALHADAVVYAGSAIPYAIGMGVSTLALNTVGGRFRPGAVLLWGMLLDGLTLLPFLWIRTPAQLWIALGIHGLATPLIVISRPTLVQTLVPGGLQGRVFGMIATAVVGCTALSSAATGALASVMDIRTLFGVIAVGAAACGALGWLYEPLRRAG